MCSRRNRIRCHSEPTAKNLEVRDPSGFALRMPALLIVLTALMPLSLSAATSPSDKQGPRLAATGSHVRAKLVADVKSIQPGTPFWVGLRLEMDPGWHTYWINPGEAGLPTKVRWRTPQGVEVGPLLWPEPQKIEAGGVVSYGYEGRVLFPAQVKTTSDLSVFDPMVLRARVDWMECADVCIPGGADVTLDLPVKVQAPVADESSREEFSRAQAALPIGDSSWRVSVIEMPSEWRLMFRPPVNEPCLGKQVSFYPDRAGLVPPSAPQKWEWVGDGCRLTMKKASLADHQSLFSGLVIRSDGWDSAGTRRALQVHLPTK